MIARVLPKNIWVKALLISLIPPIVIFFPVLISKIQWIIKLTRQFNYGFNDFDCGADFPQQCNMIQYIFGGWDGGLGLIAAIIAFAVSLIITNYIAFVIVLRRKQSKHSKIALYGGISIFCAVILYGAFLLFSAR